MTVGHVAVLPGTHYYHSPGAVSTAEGLFEATAGDTLVGHMPALALAHRHFGLVLVHKSEQVLEHKSELVLTLVDGKRVALAVE